MLADFDVPPRGFTFAVKLVRARADVPAGSISQEIGGLGAKLKSLFQFNDYALIDSAVLRGVEGRRVDCRLGDGVRAVLLDRAGGQRRRAPPVAVRAVAGREGGSQGGRSSRRSTGRRCRSTLNQTLVVGASREEQSKTALILILLAQELPRADAKRALAGQATVEKRP